MIDTTPNTKNAAQSTQSDQLSWFQTLKKAFYDAYEGIYDTISSPFRKLTTWWQGENQDKIKLEQMRAKYFQRIEDEQARPQSDYVKITKDISQETRDYVNQIVDEEIQKLGPLPCPFSIVTLGSLARSEAGPVTDLEIGFLIDKKNVDTYQYFYQLSQRLSDRLFLIGEHPDVGGKGIRIDEADNAPPHLKFFARNLTPEQNQQLLAEAIKNREWDKIPYEGSRPFLATPEEFADYSKIDFDQDKIQLSKIRKTAYEAELQKAMRAEIAKTGQPIGANRQKEIANEVRFWINNMYRPFSNREMKIATEAGTQLGRNIDHLYGDTDVSKRFFDRKNTILNEKQSSDPAALTRRQGIAKNCLIQDINDRIIKGDSIYVTGEIGKTIDLKRDLYRFTEQFVTNLGYYYSCQSQNTYEIMSELMQRGMVDLKLGRDIQDLIQFATGARLHQQKILGRQGFAAYIDDEKFQEDKQDLAEKMQRLESAIENLESLQYDPEVVSAKKRELHQLKVKYDHMLDMAPGRVISEENLALLKNKYAPMAKEIFTAAQAWLKDPFSLTPNHAMPKANEIHPAGKEVQFSPMWSKLMEEIRSVRLKGVNRDAAQPEEKAEQRRVVAPAA